MCGSTVVSEIPAALGPLIVPRSASTHWAKLLSCKSPDGSKLTTYTYDLNGNLIGIVGFEPPNGTVAITTTMTYDKENRLQVLDHNGAKTTYTYDGNGQKRSENVSGALTTIVWDGTDYLQERT